MLGVRTGQRLLKTGENGHSGGSGLCKLSLSRFLNSLPLSRSLCVLITRFVSVSVMCWQYMSRKVPKKASSCG